MRCIRLMSVALLAVAIGLFSGPSLANAQSRNAGNHIVWNRAMRPALTGYMFSWNRVVTSKTLGYTWHVTKTGKSLAKGQTVVQLVQRQHLFDRRVLRVVRSLKVVNGRLYYQIQYPTKTGVATTWVWHGTPCAPGVIP